MWSATKQNCNLELLPITSSYLIIILIIPGLKFLRIISIDLITIYG